MSNHPSLILLPPPPGPAQPKAFRAAYGPPLTAALKTLASLKLSRSTILEIALPLPSTDARIDVLESFYEIEKLVSSIYSLVCIICAKESVETEGPGGVDARVILVADPIVQDANREGALPKVNACGPVINYETLAVHRRNWRYIFTVDGVVGQDYANRYLSLARSISPAVEGEVQKVGGGVSLPPLIGSFMKPPSSDSSTMRHCTVAVGGTFDHLHVGHKLLLTATAMLLQHSTAAGDGFEKKRLIVGITGDELLKNKKYREYLASWEDRANDVAEFLKSILLFVGPEQEDEQTSTKLISSSELGSNASRAIHTLLKPGNITIECVEIQDPFGPTITDETITGLAVSGETRSGGKAINEKRIERGWKPLQVFEIAVLDAEEVPDEAESAAATATQDFASKISSSEIRKRKAELAKLGKGLRL